MSSPVPCMCSAAIEDHGGQYGTTCPPPASPAETREGREDEPLFRAGWAEGLRFALSSVGGDMIPEAKAFLLANAQRVEAEAAASPAVSLPGEAERYAADLESRLAQTNAANRFQAQVHGAAPSLPGETCRHCGSPPDADGDHSCPCPNGADCPDHPERWPHHPGLYCNGCGQDWPCSYASSEESR